MPFSVSRFAWPVVFLSMVFCPLPAPATASQPGAHMTRAMVNAGTVTPTPVEVAEKRNRHQGVDKRNDDRYSPLALDDGDWRWRRHHCCHGGWDGLGPGIALGRRLGPPLDHQDHSYDAGSYEQPIYGLHRSRVYQPGAGGGFFGRPYGDGL